MKIENPFKPYENCHNGATAVFYGSGPTILDFNPKEVEEAVIKIGLNDQIFLDLDLDYWFMGDAQPQVPSKFYDRVGDYNDYKPKIQKFIRFCTWNMQDKITIPKWGVVPRNGQLPILKNSKLYVCDEDGNPDVCLFKKDISQGNLSGVSSISFEVLQFILYCGIKRVYLVGHDCDYDNGTFAGNMIGKQQNAGYYQLRYWRIVKPWIEKNYPDVKICSINPVKLNIFDKADKIEIR
tara:strand:+ start:88 stop:798 length:711 start_codon:yes stop_codon:yes gene_type:complete